MNAKMWITVVLVAFIEESGVDPEKIAGVSFSGHGKGLYLVGADRTFGWNSGGSGHV